MRRADSAKLQRSIEGCRKWPLRAVSDAAPVNAERLLDPLPSNKRPDRLRPLQDIQLFRSDKGILGLRPSRPRLFIELVQLADSLQSLNCDLEWKLVGRCDV